MRGSLIIAFLATMLAACSEPPEPKQAAESKPDRQTEVEKEAWYLERHQSNRKGAMAIVSGCRVEPKDKQDECRRSTSIHINKISQALWRERNGDEFPIELAGRCAVMAAKAILPFAEVIAECMTNERLLHGQCDASAKITGKNYRVKGGGFYPLRKGPGNEYEKIINEKASRVTVDTSYIRIDESEIVFEECIKDDWSWVRVVNPDYLSNHRGWVQSRMLDTNSENNTGPYNGVPQRTSDSDLDSEWAEIQQQMNDYNDQVEQETRDMLLLMDELSTTAP